MKYFLIFAFIFVGPIAMARTSTCKLVSGSDSLQKFTFTTDGGVNASINGKLLRDIAHQTYYGVFYSPSYPNYHFAPRPSVHGPSIDVLKRDGSRLTYHCTWISKAGETKASGGDHTRYHTAATTGRRNCYPSGPAAFRNWPLGGCKK